MTRSYKIGGQQNYVHSIHNISATQVILNIRSREAEICIILHFFSTMFSTYYSVCASKPIDVSKMANAEMSAV